MLTLDVVTEQGKNFVGSAFLAFESGIAVTAWHVIHDARTIQAHFADDDDAVPGEVLAHDATHDLALIRVPLSRSRPLLPLERIPPAIASRVFVIGAPRGYEFSITDGLVSQIQRIDGFDQYQISSPISPGNSGGPILNSRGEVIGVCAWSKKGAQNLNFGIPSGFISDLYQQKYLNASPAAAGQAPAQTAALESTVELNAASRDAGDYEEFMQYLRASAGKRVSIQVSTDGEESVFSFILRTPAGLQKSP